jgi:hypothetical protein
VGQARRTLTAHLQIPDKKINIKASRHARCEKVIVLHSLAVYLKGE